MATQRITLAKIGGLAADHILQRLRAWCALRQMDDPELWSYEQWPVHVQQEADDFAVHLRANAYAPPVIHFIEWVDQWSMGDLFARWLYPPGTTQQLAVHAKRFEIFSYALPDEERLAQFLAAAGPQQWPETDWYIARLREAIDNCQRVLDQSVIIVLRHVVGGSVLHEDLKASLQQVPDWLS